MKGDRMLAKQLQEAYKEYMEVVMFLRGLGHTEEEIGFLFNTINTKPTNPDLEKRFDELLEIVGKLNDKVEIIRITSGSMYTDHIKK